jgi:hypothetical protein
VFLLLGRDTCFRFFRSAITAAHLLDTIRTGGKFDPPVDLLVGLDFVDMCDPYNFLYDDPTQSVSPLLPSRQLPLFFFHFIFFWRCLLIQLSFAGIGLSFAL